MEHILSHTKINCKEQLSLSVSRKSNETFYFALSKHLRNFLVWETIANSNDLEIIKLVISDCFLMGTYFILL